MASLLPLVLLLSFSAFCHSETTTVVSTSSSSISPLTPKASLLRYWARKITNNHPRPDFFISKLSPLSPPAFAAFSSLSPSQLSSNLPAFCSSAHLACPLAASSSDISKAHEGPSNFKTYRNANFTNYAPKGVGLTSAFSNYSDDLLSTDSFHRYSLGATGDTDSFTSYTPAPGTQIPTTNFTSYSTSATGGSGDFSTYHPNTTVPILTFTTYDTDAKSLARDFSTYNKDSGSSETNFTSYGKRGRGGVSETFTRYDENIPIPNTIFTSYGNKELGAKDNFTSYGRGSSIPILKFSAYDSAGTNADRDFAAYNDGANSGHVDFQRYGRKGDAVATGFTSYASDVTTAQAGFKSYGEGGKGSSSEEFKAYGRIDGDFDHKFGSYGAGADGGGDKFQTYGIDVGSNEFDSYGKKGTNGRSASFVSYEKSTLMRGTDDFKRYGEGSSGDVFNFTTYGAPASDQFESYEKKGNKITFNSYANSSASSDEKVSSSRRRSGILVNRGVEPGKFFRERELKKGTVMPMPDIRDKMPARSFLPRSIAANIPFSAGEIREVFKLPADNVMGKAVGDTITECERAPSRGETKKCAASAEDMIDFAISVLGSDVVVRSTENTRGSKGSIMIGDVKGVNGGKITQSVSCHQSLFPYLVYYCHSVPKVRVYEANIMSVDGKEKINHGIAICHIDTSDWSAGHGAFLALGSAPGKIEVCHWIFEGDMTWAKAD